MRLLSQIGFIKNRVRKKKLRDWRAFLRSYRTVKTEQKMGRILSVKHLLMQSSCISRGHFSKNIFGSAVGDAEIVVRQLLNNNLVAYRSNKTFIKATADNRYIITYPFPKRYRELLRREGYNVSGFRSGFFFGCYVWLRFFKGIAAIGKEFWKSLRETGTRQQKKLGRYVVFCWLDKRCLPHNGKGKSYDVISWYLQWKGSIPKPDAVVHTVKNTDDITVDGTTVVAADANIPHLIGFAKLLRYATWGIGVILLSLVDIFRGRWWHAFMLPDASEAAVVRIQDVQKLAADYLLHTSFWIYRPLWTYDAEKKGTRILFYFYSTNIEPCKQKNGYPQPIFGWKTATWSHYLVWDEYQAAYLKQFSNAAITVVGPIWFQGGTERLPLLPADAFAVFDVQPRRDALYALLTMEFDYYTPETSIPFLADIQHCLKEAGASMVLKRKRKIGKIEHAKYTTKVRELAKEENFISIDPDLPAQTVIENCRAVISMPFTSTALIGKQFGKPSVYYDPCGLIQKDDKAAHGIDIITGADELRKWVKEVMAQS